MSTKVTNITKKTIVIHSGGMDSSICLALAAREFGSDQVLSMSFRYGQTHSNELDQAKLIAKEFGVAHVIVDVNCFMQLTHSALLDASIPIVHNKGEPPNTIVLGRNGFMMRMAAIHGHELGASIVYTGIIGVDGANSGYRDCSREYTDLMEQVLRLDLDNEAFEIRTPVIDMTKKQTMDLANSLGILRFLLEETITCYRNIAKEGCMGCPACVLRNNGIREFLQENPNFEFSYKNKL